ncbi:uncharacterized protein LOC143453880 [Clavelina lepadiformis]|uniref:Uncharacterized protein n=1 Tax=Clavelina lepadiformis TaxID=159417 RepID=A0ABP0G540_CLALP
MENSDRFYEPFLPPPLPPNRSNTTLSKIYDTVRPQLLRPDALPAATADLKKGATLPRNTAFSPDSQPIKAVTSPTFKKDNKPAELPVPPALSPSPPALPKRDIPYVNGSNSRPHTNVDTLSSQKLDSIYRMVSCIDQRLKNHFNPPQPPPRDDEPLSPKLKSSVPPPRPVKTTAATKVGPVKSDHKGKKTLSRQQCQTMVTQMMCIREFIDENFDPAYVDKIENMAYIDEIIETLS